MANEFDLKPSFPIAGVADLYANRSQKEAQIRQAQNAQLMQGLQQFSEGINSLVTRRQQMAQAMVLAQNPEVQDMVSGGDRPVTQGPAGPVRLDQTAQGGVGQDPIQNGTQLPQAATLLQGQNPLEVLKASFARKQAMQPVTDVIQIKDAAGNIVGHQEVTHSRGGKTMMSGPQPIPATPRATPGEGAMQKAVVKAKVSLAELKPVVSSVLKEIDRVELLNSNSFGGKLGEMQMKTRSALNSGTDDVRFKNTADIVNTMKQQVAKALKSTFPGALSDSEREYLNYVYGAVEGMSQQERAIAMTNVKKTLTTKLEAAQSTLSELAGNDSVGAAPAPAPPPPPSPAPNPDLAHLSTKELLDLRKRMTAHKEKE